jgi:hypothetical protein
MKGKNYDEICDLINMFSQDYCNNNVISTSFEDKINEIEDSKSRNNLFYGTQLDQKSTYFILVQHYQRNPIFSLVVGNGVSLKDVLYLYHNKHKGSNSLNDDSMVCVNQILDFDNKNDLYSRICYYDNLIKFACGRDNHFEDLFKVKYKHDFDLINHRIIYNIDI